VQGLPGGNKVVSAGWSKAFTGIQAGTIVTLTYKDSSGCQFQSWWVSGGQAPTGNPIAVTVNSDREVIALCLPVTVTPTPTPFVQVQITSPEDGYSTDNRLLTMLGTVTSTNDINIETGATITLNGESRSLPLTHQGTEGYNYIFSTTLELVQGSNSIMVTATDSQNNSGSDTVTVNADIPIVPISIELTWNTNGTDVDSHLIAPCYPMWDSFGDCYFGHRNPDWDNSGGSSAGDPSLDVDDTNGYGPENIVLVAPPFDGIYQYKVHYYSDNGYGPSTATVKIWINGVKGFEGNRTLSSGQVWDCACIEWQSESGTVTAGSSCSLRTLTVTSEGCCPILVEGLPCGERTVPAGTTRVFYGIAQNGNVTLTAQSGDFCSFGNWTIDGEVADSGSAIQLTMDTDHTAIAACTPLYTLTVTNTGCWAVYITGLPDQGQQEEWVDQNETREFPGIPKDTQVTITPSQGDGILFTGWYVDAEGSPRLDNPLVITMGADHQVTAVCVPEYNLTVTSQGCCPVLVEDLPGGNQTVPAGDSNAFYHIPENTEITLTAQTGDSCRFDYWTVDDQLPNTNQTIVVTMDSDQYVTAVCTPLYTLTVTSEGCCPILVSNLPQGNQTVPAGGNSTFSGIPQDTEITLEAVDEGNCTFDYWEIHSFEVTGDNLKITQVTMNDNHTAICWSHVPTTYTLSVTSSGCCPIDVTGLPGNPTIPAGGNATFTGIPQGTEVTLYAQGGDFCSFDYWVIDAGNQTEENPITLTMNQNHAATVVCSEETIVWRNPSNGHYYELVYVDEGINWLEASVAAASRVFEGIPGHLATVTSAEENLWLTDTFTGDALHYHWIGGFQLPDSTEPDGGWKWVTGEPWDFSNWFQGEPNNDGGSEDSVLFDHLVTDAGKSWNDGDGTRTIYGYLVEYEYLY
jgi:uncharacterized protein YfaP (DUF2135 family)